MTMPNDQTAVQNGGSARVLLDSARHSASRVDRHHLQVDLQSGPVGVSAGGPWVAGRGSCRGSIRARHGHAMLELARDLRRARAEMPERHAPGHPAPHATARPHRRRCSPANGAFRVPPWALHGGPARAAQLPSTRERRRPAVRSRRPHLPRATYRPGSGPDSEHAAEWPGAYGPLLLRLLHDFPDPGKFHRNSCSSPPSDTPTGL
jgi:hypothetical protein